jgi:hypothetical protein
VCGVECGFEVALGEGVGLGELCALRFGVLKVGEEKDLAIGEVPLTGWWARVVLGARAGLRFRLALSAGGFISGLVDRWWFHWDRCWQPLFVPRFSGGRVPFLAGRVATAGV